MSTERYYVKRPSGKLLGPFDKNAIAMMLKSNRLGADAQISQDKETWMGLEQVPEFAQVLGAPTDLPSPRTMDLPSPLSGRDLPSALGSNLPQTRRADGLPSPVGTSGLPDALSALPERAAGLPQSAAGLPQSAAGLPQSAAGLPQSAAGLPQSAAGLPQSAAGLPLSAPGLPQTSADLSAPQSTLTGRPAPKPSGTLPPPLGGVSNLPPLGGMRSAHPTQAGLPNQAVTNFPPIGDVPQQEEESEDLFGAPLSVVQDGNDLFDAPSEIDEDLFADSSVAASEDLFGSPLSVVESEANLFGGPLSAAQDDEDLFGGAPSMAQDDDLFGADPSQDQGEDLFGAAPSMPQEEDLFGGPLSEAQSNIGGADFGNVDFGQAEPSQAEDMFGGTEDDLFSGNSVAQDDLFADEEIGDDFLSGDQGFSFLDESPAAPAAAPQEPEDDLFQSNSPGFAPSQNTFEEIDDFETSSPKPSAPARAPEPAAAPASGGMMASSGIKSQEDKAVKEESKRRGLATTIGLPVLIVLILAGGCYALYNTFKTTETGPVKTVKKGRRIKIEMDALKGANFAELREIINSSKKAKMSPAGMGKVLLAHALVLANHQDIGIAKSAKELAQKLKGAKEPQALLGLGAYTAVTDGAEAAKPMLEPLTSNPKEVGLFANLFMGIALSKQALDVPYVVGSLQPADPTKQPEPSDEPQNEQQPTAEDSKPEDTADQPAKDQEASKDVAPAPTQPAKNDLWDQAMASLKAAAAINPTIAQYWIGRLQEHASQPALAKDAYKSSLKSSEQYIPSVVALGRLEFTGGNLNEAKDNLETVTTQLASRAHPHDKAEAHEYLGRVWIARLKNDLAIKNLTKSLELDSSRVGALRALAESYENAGMHKEALSFFKTNKSMGAKDPDVILGVARAYIGLKQWPQAIAQLEVGQNAFPEDGRFPEQLGQTNMERGTFFEAQKAFERAVEIDPTRLDALAQLAQLAWLKDNQRNFDKGEEYIKRIVAQPKALTAAVAMEVAEFYDMANRPNFAKSWYKAAIKRDPNLWLARLALSKLLLKQGETKDALRILERSRKEGVEDMRLTANLADAYRQSKLYDRAIDEINRIIEKDPKQADYVFIRGRIHFDRKNYDTAKQDFLKAYELDSSSYDARFYVGRTAYEQGDIKTAINIYREVLDYVPSDGDYRFRMGRAMEKQGRLPQALDEYKRVTVVDPGYGARNPELFIVRGRLAGRMGLSKQGRADLDRALELEPNNVDALIAMGEMEFDEKQYDKAIKYLTDALEKQPTFPDAQRKLGMAYIYNKRSVEGARRLQLAIRYGYEDPDIYRTLGFVYKELGQRGQALNAFQTFMTKIAGDKSVPLGTRREALKQIKELGG